MEGNISFTFEGIEHTAGFLICQRNYPTYIYINFSNSELIRQFGEEIIIHSDGMQMINDNIHTQKRQELFSTIFNEIKNKISLEINFPVIAKT